MSQKIRVLIVVGALLLVAVILAIVGFTLQRQAAQAPMATPQPGMIHLYVNGAFVANVSPADMQKLPSASFKDKEEGKLQEGWWLRDVVRSYVQETKLSPNSRITVTGSRQGTEKSATVTWAEALDPANNLAFDLAGDGQSVKLASTMDQLSTRDEWVQGVSRIDIQTQP
jgi:hypothetical protein